MEKVMNNTLNALAALLLCNLSGCIWQGAKPNTECWAGGCWQRATQALPPLSSPAAQPTPSFRHPASQTFNSYDNATQASVIYGGSPAVSSSFDGNHGSFGWCKNYKDSNGALVRRECGGCKETKIVDESGAGITEHDCGTSSQQQKALGLDPVGAAKDAEAARAAKGSTQRSPDAPSKKEVCETAEAFSIAASIDAKMIKASHGTVALSAVDMWSMAESYMEDQDHMTTQEALRNINYFNSNEAGPDFDLMQKCAGLK
jgi:hypothetical protein